MTSVVGKPAARVGAAEIVTGKARYIADLDFPGMLVGALLYPALSPARVVHIDASRARDLPGVISVLTHADIPGLNRYAYSDAEDQPLLVGELVQYQGDALAAVAAVDEAAARAALAAIEVALDPIEGIFDPVEAMAPGARRVWPDRGNEAEHLAIERGDVEAGLSRADIVVEGVYTTQMVEQAFLEPEGAVATVEPDGTMVVYASSQAPHRDRRQIARALGVPENRVRVITPFIGGAFGGKDEAHVQIHAALLAQATGRPVRMVRTREESIRTHVKRHPVRISYTTGATRDGLLTAIRVEAIGDTGPYLNAGAEVMSVLAASVFGPYTVPNARIDAYTVLTHNPICGAMRGFGIPQGMFACERQMDKLAHQLGIDPLQIRLLNGLETGVMLPTGAILREGRPMKACLHEAAERSGWRQRGNVKRNPAPHLRRGWGLAANIFTVGLGRDVADNAAVSLEMNPDGTAILRTGASDMGQGVHTTLAQIAAEELGIELDAIRLVTPDTDRTPDAGPSSASRATFLSGNATRRAAATIRSSLLQSASRTTSRPLDELTLRNGYLYAAGEQVTTVAHVAAAAKEANLPLHSDGFYAMEYPEQPPDDAYPYAHQVFTFGTQVARVLVDTQTGRVTVEELTVVQDAGRVINPDGAYGQLEGGAAMGLGYALIEELHTSGGRTLNNSLEDYLIPTSVDVPPMKVGIVEIPEPLAPFGAKGIGEATLTPTAPAVANAVADALGVEIDQLPLSPERVLAAISGRGDT
jgi:CO/xanthine dehydrogenase Mo-binding subunit